MVLEVMKTKVTWAEVLANLTRVAKHSQITLAHLIDAAIHTRAEHGARNRRRLKRLHRLVPQDPRFPIESDVTNVRDADTGFVKTVLNGVKGKAAVVLDARKALFFRGGHYLAVV